MALESVERSRRSYWLGGLGLTILLLLFFAQYWNHFLAMRTAFGSSLIAQFMSEGRMPYRDFFLMVPPLQFLKTQVIVAAFGPQLIAPYAVAVVERVLLALVVYIWLCFYHRPAVAFAASLTAAVVSCGDGADMMTSYNHATILWVVVTGSLTDIALRTDGTPLFLSCSLAAGIASGICVGMKQTLGAGVTVMIPFVAAVLLFRRNEPKRLLDFIGTFAIGWLLPVGGLLYWLWSHQILDAFLDMTYGSGTKGKGSLAQIFLRPLTLTLDRMFLTVSALLGVAILFLGYWLIRRSPSQPARDTHSLSNSFASTMAWATLAIVLGILAGRTGLDRPGWGRDTVMKGVVYAVFLGTTWQTLRYAVLAIRRPLSKEEQTFWLQYGVSATVAATLALSWPAFEAMVVPGLAVLLCLLFSHSSRIAIAICLFLTYSMTVIKIETPFYWDGLRDEPVRGDMVNMQHPLLRGFRLPRATADLTQHITATIQAHSSKDETIFIYPGLVAFYLLADRRPPTFAYDHTMDIAPDDLCRADARRLLARTPAVILEYIASTETIEQREAVWRAGRISGQRDLIAAIRTLTPTYRFHETYPLPGGGVLHLWAKK